MLELSAEMVNVFKWRLGHHIRNVNVVFIPKYEQSTDFIVQSLIA